MSGVDYSKWETLNIFSSSSTCSSSNDDDVEDDATHTEETAQTEGPLSVHRSSCDRTNTHTQGEVGSGRNVVNVVRLTYPARVVLGPDGARAEVRVAPPHATASPFRISAPQPGGSLRRLTGVPDCSEDSSPALEPQAPASRKAAPIAEEEDARYRELTCNGSREGNSHLWSQTRETVTIAFIVPRATRGSHIHRLGVHRCTHHRAPTPTKGVGGLAKTDEWRLDFVNECVPSAEEDDAGFWREHTHTFCYPVDTKHSRSIVNGASVPTLDESVDDDEVDRDSFDASCWELITLKNRGLRLLVVTVAKATMGSGVYHWWDRVFVTDKVAVPKPPCGWADWKEAKGGGPALATDFAQKGDGTEFVAAGAATEAWRKAHDMFRERVQARKSKRPD